MKSSLFLLACGLCSASSLTTAVSAAVDIQGVSQSQIGESSLDSLFAPGVEVSAFAVSQFGNLYASVAVTAWGLGVAGGSATSGFEDTLTIFGGSGTGSLAWSVSSFTTGPTPTLNLPASFTFGQPFDIGAAVNVSDYIYGFEHSDRSTARLSIQLAGVFDSEGRELTGYSWRTDSATDYGFKGTVAPEPRTWWLVGVALIGIVGRKRDVQR